MRIRDFPGYSMQMVAKAGLDAEGARSNLHGHACQGILRQDRKGGGTTDC
jgi:hypothetical protein